jgi:PAS domain-containing protein
MEPWAKKQVPDDGSTMKDESDAMPAVESGAGSGVESDAESNVRSDADSNALKVSEQRFNDIAEVASDWFWETDAQLRFTYIGACFRGHRRQTGISLWQDAARIGGAGR